MQKITPFLWFNTNAEEAVLFYTSVFRNSKVTHVARYDKAGAKVSGQPEGSVMTMGFELNGQKFTALNGGPHYKFSGAISFVVNCETQQEVDYYWDALSAEGTIQECGWLTDKYGITWQIVPAILGTLLASKDPAKTKRVMEAMLKMKKLDIKALKRAHDQQ